MFKLCPKKVIFINYLSKITIKQKTITNIDIRKQKFQIIFVQILYFDIQEYNEFRYICIFLVKIAKKILKYYQYYVILIMLVILCKNRSLDQEDKKGLCAS